MFHMIFVQILLPRFIVIKFYFVFNVTFINNLSKRVLNLLDKINSFIYYTWLDKKNYSSYLFVSHF